MAKEEFRRVYRSKKNRLVGGVCGGIADYFGIDPVLVRLLFVLLGLIGLLGVAVYLVAWLLIPEGEN